MMWMSFFAASDMIRSSRWKPSSLNTPSCEAGATHCEAGTCRSKEAECESAATHESGDRHLCRLTEGWRELPLLHGATMPLQKPHVRTSCMPFPAIVCAQDTLPDQQISVHSSQGMHRAHEPLLYVEAAPTLSTRSIGGALQHWIRTHLKELRDLAIRQVVPA